MSNRSSIYALAAAALVGAATLASTGASAHPVMGVIIKKPGPQGLMLPPQHPVMGVVLHPVHPIFGVIVRRPDEPHFWWHHQHGPVMIEGGETIRETIHETAHVSAPVASTPTAPCNCLTKTYLQDGSLQFTDICTRESAVATPDQLRAQAQGTGPQVH